MKLLYLVIGCCLAVCACVFLARTVRLWRNLRWRQRAGNVMQALASVIYASLVLLSAQESVKWDHYFPLFIAGWMVWFAGVIIGAPDEWRKPIRFPRFRRRSTERTDN